MSTNKSNLQIFSTENNIIERNSLYLQMNTEFLLNNAPLIRYSNRMIKRAFDIITALIILMLFFPWIYLIIACCIKSLCYIPFSLNRKELAKMG